MAWYKGYEISNEEIHDWLCFINHTHTHTHTRIATKLNDLFEVGVGVKTVQEISHNLMTELILSLQRNNNMPPSAESPKLFEMGALSMNIEIFIIKQAALYILICLLVSL